VYFLNNYVWAKTQLLSAVISDLNTKLDLFFKLNAEAYLPEILLIEHNSYGDLQIFIVEQLIKNDFFKNCVELQVSFYTICAKLGIDTFLWKCICACFAIFFCFLFISCLLTVFNNDRKDEKTLDYDQVNYMITLESEKEITSFDDILLTLVIFTYVFGWYFFNYFWSIIICNTEMAFLCFFLSLMYFVIIGVPTFLVYEFGINFLLYLKGVSSSSVLFIELVYDYIAVLVFYTRIIVQGVRLVLMVFVYASMHDLVMLSPVYEYNFFFNDCVTSYSFFNLSSYYIFVALPGAFFYLVYEIFHVYFVVTVQTVAFFAIVFWLFLFLYSFFVIEKQESYFNSKRKNIL